jgi:phosphatidylethanolamine/phosphatidyl-N-methylethanolamine N-methyltransferase
LHSVSHRGFAFFTMPHSFAKAAARRAAHKFRDEARFIKSWVDMPQVVGAVLPSSRWLARQMVSALDPQLEGLVVELGPGTGPVTRALLRRGFAQERLVLVEFNPEFCKSLRKEFPKARVIEGDAYNLPLTLKGVLEQPALAFVSSLPLLMRPDEDRLKLLDDALALMVPQGPFIQFTYSVASPIAFDSKAVQAHVSHRIWRNFPPARVWTYRRRPDISG